MPTTIKQTKHTPGPWKVWEPEFANSNGGKLVLVPWVLDALEIDRPE
jgi:hypothetical protein